MNLLNRIKNKRGDAMIMSYLIIFLFIMFMAFIVDFGTGYTNKVQIQSIADAAAIGGANWAKEAYVSVADGKKIAVVDPQKSTSMANSLITANSKFLMDRAALSSPTYNQPGKVVNGVAMSSRDQYYSGSFNVKLSGAYQSFFLGTDFFGNGQIFPFLRYKAESRVQVTPQ